MNLPPPAEQYDRTNEAETRRALSAADQQNLKRGANIQLQPDQYIILPDETTGDLYRLKVDSGVLSIVTFP